MNFACTARLNEQPIRADIMKNPPVIDEYGTINWGGGLYAVLDQNGGEGLDARASNILKHRATGNTIDIDAEYNATEGWSLRNNHDDHAAQLYRTAAHNYLCRKFFGDGLGPKAVKVLRGNDPHWNQLVKDAVATVWCLSRTMSPSWPRLRFRGAAQWREGVRWSRGGASWSLPWLIKSSSAAPGGVYLNPLENRYTPPSPGGVYLCPRGFRYTPLGAALYRVFDV